MDKINALAKTNGAKITYIMLPLLISDFPGIEDVDLKLQEVAKQNDHVSYVNFSAGMQSSTYFYDHMHFNTKGILFFASKFFAE